MAGGRPVGSTDIADMMEPYGRLGLVEVGDGAHGCEAAIDRTLATERVDIGRRADAYLGTMSWDRT